MPSENYGEKAGDGVKGVFKSIDDVGETLRTNINGALDGFGDAITGKKSHTSSSHSNLTSSSAQNDAENVRRDMNKGIDDAGKEVEDFVHHHKQMRR